MILIGQQPGDEGRASKYDPEHCMTIRLLAQDGKFPEEWAAHIGVHMGTLRNWANTHPEFREAVLIARVLITTWWTDRARKYAEGKKGNQLVLVEVLRKRFPELYGRAPASTWDFLLTPEELQPEAVPEDAATPPIGAQPSPSTGPITTMTEEQIKKRLEELQARRKQTGGRTA
jgi:hypothetical protein